MEAVIEVMSEVVRVLMAMALALAVGFWLLFFVVRVFRGERLVITDRDRRFVRNGLSAIALGAAVACICSTLSSRPAPVNPPRFRIGDD